MDQRNALFSLITTLLFVVQTISAPTDTSQSLVVTSTETSISTESENENNAPTVPQIYQMHIQSNVHNRYANTTIVSKVRNLDKRAQEATFSVVLPETAFISGFIMEVDGKNYTAHVKEKEEAKNDYDEAVSHGLGAAHVATSVRDSNRFTVSLNIEPETKAAFYLSYEELLKRQDGHYEQIINIHPGQPVKDLNVEVFIKESRKIKELRAPPLRSGNEIGSEKSELDPRADLETINDKTAVVRFSPNIERQKQLAHLLGVDENKGLAGQFIVQYDVERDPQGGEVLIQDGYFVHFFSPSELAPLPKHVVFVLDTSSSMHGQKIEQLKEAMRKILEELHENDLFNLVEFNSVVKVWDLYNDSASSWYPYDLNNGGFAENNERDSSFEKYAFPKAYLATVSNIKQAKNTISEFRPSAATDIYTALKVGLHLVELAKSVKIDTVDRQPILIFLTDGQPTSGLRLKDVITNKISEFNVEARTCPIFALSFGHGTDKKFLEKLAIRNSGFAKHIYEAADAALQLQDFYRQISSPLLSNVHFKYEPTITSLTKTEFPVHFKGSEIVISGRYRGETEMKLPDIDAWGATGKLSLKPQAIEQSVSNIERLWAYMTIKQLLEKKEVADKDKKELERKALDLALKYSFVTPLSSLVVIKPNATNSVDTEDASEVSSRRSDIRARGGKSLMSKRKKIVTSDSYSNDYFVGDFSIKRVGNSVPYRGDSSRSLITFASVPITQSANRYQETTIDRISSSEAINQPQETTSVRRHGLTTFGKSVPKHGDPGHALTTLATVPITESANQYQETTVDQISSTESPKEDQENISALTRILPWLEAILHENELLELPSGKYKLGLNETIIDNATCSNPPFNATGHCSLLQSCPQSHSHLISVDVFVKHFCILKNEYAGVCCPDNL